MRDKKLHTKIHTESREILGINYHQSNITVSGTYVSTRTPLAARLRCFAKGKFRFAQASATQVVTHAPRTRPSAPPGRCRRGGVLAFSRKATHPQGGSGMRTSLTPCSCDRPGRCPTHPCVCVAMCLHKSHSIRKVKCPPRKREKVSHWRQTDLRTFGSSAGAASMPL